MNNNNEKDRVDDRLTTKENPSEGDTLVTDERKRLWAEKHPDGWFEI
jgi:hypothetical protein